MINKEIFKLLAFVIYSLCVIAVSAGITYNVTDANWQSKWESHLKEDAEINAKQAEIVIQRQNKFNEGSENADKITKVKQDSFANDVADTKSAGDSLRNEINRVENLPTNNDTTITRISANAATDRLVLTGLLKESDRMAEEFATQADRNKIAVDDCNARYNHVRESFKM